MEIDRTSHRKTKTQINFQQIPLPVKLRSDTTFENFIDGKNSAVISYLKNPHEQFIFLWGKDGVGKTHLLQACCHANINPGFYLSCINYENYSPIILANLEHLALICIDDTAAIAAQVSWEEAIFHLYNRCLQTGTRLIFSAQAPAQEIPFTLKDLHSRLAAAVSFVVEDLSDSEKITVLQNHAHARGMELTEEIGQFLLRRCDRSLTNLLFLLDKLDEASLSAQRKLTIPFVKVALQL